MWKRLMVRQQQTDEEEWEREKGAREERKKEMGGKKVRNTCMGTFDTLAFCKRKLILSNIISCNRAQQTAKINLKCCNFFSIWLESTYRCVEDRKSHRAEKKRKTGEKKTPAPKSEANYGKQQQQQHQQNIQTQIWWSRARESALVLFSFVVFLQLLGESMLFFSSLRSVTPNTINVDHVHFEYH